MAALNPLLEIIKGNSGHNEFAPMLPTVLIVSEVVAKGGIAVVEAEHNLVLVKRAIGIVLVNDIYILAVPLVGGIGEEYVNVVAVHTFRATNVAVGVLHGGLPLIAVGILATAH